MNKKELVAAVSEKTGMTDANATEAVDAVFDTIINALRKKDEVKLLGFGTFFVTRRAAREGRNPATGQRTKIRASTQARFRAGKGLKDALGGDGDGDPDYTDDGGPGIRRRLG